MARQPLGRGLNALIGEPAAAPATGHETGSEIDIDLIDPNPEQPRSHFDVGELADLAASIQANGIVQPIVIRPNGGRFQIIAGERRWRAAQKAGLRRVPAVIKEIPDDKLLELALVENIQRQELNPIEEANAYPNLLIGLGLRKNKSLSALAKNAR